MLVTPCERHRNAVCRCEVGYYRSYIDSDAYECVKCRRCDPTEKESQKCESSSKRRAARRFFIRSVEKQMKFHCCSPLRAGTPEQNTVCQCEDNYYRHNKKCEPCSKCVDLFTRDSDGCTTNREVSIDETYSRVSLFPFLFLWPTKEKLGYIHTSQALPHIRFERHRNIFVGEIFFFFFII